MEGWVCRPTGAMIVQYYTHKLGVFCLESQECGHDLSESYVAARLLLVT
jgi:hypothetical protein